MSKGCLYIFWIVVIMCCSIGRASFITCEERTAQTSVYLANYSVKKRQQSITECQKDSDRKSELAMPPGAPWEVMATLAGQNLTVTWRPPNDGSVQFLSGFLVEVYVDTPIYKAGPDVCYIVNLGEWLRIDTEVPFDRNCPLPQDSIFRLNCTVTGLDRGLIDFIYVTSLPMPTHDIKRKILNIGHFVNGKSDDWTTWSTCTDFCKEDIRTYDRICEIQQNEKQNSKPGNQILILVFFTGFGVLCLVITVTYFVCRARISKTFKASTMTTSIEDSHARTVLNTDETMMNNMKDHTDETINGQTGSSSTKHFDENSTKHSISITDYQRRLYSKRDHICYKDTEQDCLLPTSSSASTYSPPKYISPKGHLDVPIPEHIVFLPPEPLSNFIDCVATVSPSKEPEVEHSEMYTSLPPEYTSVESNHQGKHLLLTRHEDINIPVHSATYSSAVTNCHSTVSPSVKHSQNLTFPKFFKDFINEVNMEQ